MSLFCLVQLPVHLPERLVELMEHFSWAFRKQFVRLEHIFVLWLPAPVWDCVPHPDTRWEAVQGTESASLPCCRQFSFPVVRASGSLGSADPRSAGPWGQPVFRGPPLPSRAFVPRWPLLQGAGALREGAAEQRQWLEPGRGRAAGPRCSLRPGRASSVRERAERGGSGGQRREVGTERSGAAGAGDAKCERGRLRCPAPRRGPGGGMAALPWGGFAVRWALFTCLKLLWKEGSVSFWRLKAESRDEGDFPGHQVRVAGPQGRCARAGGQGVIHSGLLEVSGDVPKSTHE